MVAAFMRSLALQRGGSVATKCGQGLGGRAPDRAAGALAVGGSPRPRARRRARSRGCRSLCYCSRAAQSRFKCFWSPADGDAIDEHVARRQPPVLLPPPSRDGADSEARFQALRPDDVASLAQAYAGGNVLLGTLCLCAACAFPLARPLARGAHGGLHVVFGGLQCIQHVVCNGVQVRTLTASS